MEVQRIFAVEEDRLDQGDDLATCVVTCTYDGHIDHLALGDSWLLVRTGDGDGSVAVRGLVVASAIVFHADILVGLVGLLQLTL